MRTTNSQSKILAEPLLTGLSMSITIGKGLDSDSYLSFMLFQPFPGQWVDYADCTVHGALNNGEVRQFSLAIKNNTVALSQISSCFFYIAITANGRDECSGSINLTFTFSDGTIITWGFGVFDIGTYQMSHDTYKRVALPPINKKLINGVLIKFLETKGPLEQLSTRAS